MNLRGMHLSPDAPGNSGGPVLPEGLPPPPRDDASRSASVTFRPIPGRDEVPDSLDPANQSLMDALRITFRLVQLAMVVLLGLFLLSGFQSVKENEKGIRLVFGEVDRADLPPGFQFSWPYPVGELIKVDQGTKDLRLDKAFWMFLKDANEASKPLDQLPKRARLNPSNDGALLTADGNLAHTRWQVRYRRTDATKFARNLVDEDEANIVASAVQRGVVQAVARVKIDELLKQTDRDDSSVAILAREVAQRTLDRIESGIVIEQLRMTDRTPPMYVLDKFNALQSAAQQAGKKREEAATEARQTLNQAAGAAVKELLEAIGEYELAVDQKNEAKKTEVLARIDTILEGRSGVDAAGLPASQSAGDVSSSPKVSGDVSRIIAEARQYRSEIVSRRQREAETFAAKLQQFRSNPLVMVHNEWSAGLRAFMSRDTTQMLINPPGTGQLELVLNSDPDVVKELDRARRRSENKAAEERRREEQKKEQFRTSKGLQAKD
jgi:modulator of FtsH protease HflK